MQKLDRILNEFLFIHGKAIHGIVAKILLSVVPERIAQYCRRLQRLCLSRFKKLRFESIEVSSWRRFYVNWQPIHEVKF